MDFLPIIVMIICLFATTNTGSGLSSGVVPIEIVPREVEVEKVQLTVYYEALCPYCENFIVNYLIDVFSDGIDTIADVKLIPYGNAKIMPNGTIKCQHGELECVLNTVEACAIHAWPDVHQHFPFVLCVERLIYKGKSDEWETCFDKLGLDSTPVSECVASGEGKKLELQYASETNDLEPPHTYVPWVVVDGEPLYDDYIYVVSYICRAYKGPTLPRACLRCLDSSKGGIRTPKDRAFPINPVTYKDQTKESVLSKVRSIIASWMPGAAAALEA